jgi:hypothetical protein
MNDGIVVTALDARTNFGKLSSPSAGWGSLRCHREARPPASRSAQRRDYVGLVVPEPEVLRAIGMESRRKGTNRLSTTQIDRIVKAARKSKRR